MRFAVPYGEATPQARLHVVGAESLQLVFDPPGHDVLLPGEGAHLPDGAVGEVLLDIGEAGDSLARDQKGCHR
jgi:hypothetical protein